MKILLVTPVYAKERDLCSPSVTAVQCSPGAVAVGDVMPIHGGEEWQSWKLPLWNVNSETSPVPKQLAADPFFSALGWSIPLWGE